MFSSAQFIIRCLLLISSVLSFSLSLLRHTVPKSTRVQQFPILLSEIEQKTLFLQGTTASTAPCPIDLRLWSARFCMADSETVLRITLSLARRSTSLMPAIGPAITRHCNVCRAISCVVLGTFESLSQTGKLSALWPLWWMREEMRWSVGSILR